MNRLVFLDTETTGIGVDDGHLIIEIGCLDVIGREISDQNFHVYLNPERDIDEEAIRVHGIDNSMVRDKPTFDVIIESLLDYVRDAEVIIHNAEFDLGFLNAEIHRVNDKKGTTYPAFEQVCAKITDSLQVARKRFSGMKNTLDALCQRLEIDATERAFHGALLDANLLAQVWLKLTGGQKTMDLQSGKKNPTLATSGYIRQKPLAVIHATTEELERHNTYMQSLKKTS